MRHGFRTTAVLCVLGVTAVAGSGCTAMIWGADGARVIDATEQLIEDATPERETTLLCPDADVELGSETDRAGLSAGEPERFNPEYWEERVALDPQWNINLQGLPDGAESGDRIPGDLFFRMDEKGLCVIDVGWVTLESVG